MDDPRKRSGGDASWGGQSAPTGHQMRRGFLGKMDARRAILTSICACRGEPLLPVKTVPGLRQSPLACKRYPFMQYVLIIHEVADYEAWKKVFDGAAAIRKEAGERSYQVLKYDHDPNRIVHFSRWTSHAEARAFFESPRLVQIRKDAGVKAPDFIYLDQLEAGTL
ncbi:MAG: antibiotic biosynthesis monooxygenase [Chthoniobacteraceae bacterium]